MPRKKGDIQTHTPTKDSREVVEFLAAAGLNETQIGYVLGVGKSCVSRRYRDEINRGLPKSIAKMAQSLYKQGIEGNVGAAIFWLKSRGGWRESYNFNIQSTNFDIAEPADTNAEDKD